MAKPRAYDIEKAAYLVSTFQSALYFLEHMRLATNFPSRGRLIDHALDQAPADGLILEMEVGDGASLRRLASRTNGPVYGFDSFEGLPEDWTHFQRRGRYSRSGEPPGGLPSNVTLVRGWFEDTLPSFLAEHHGARTS